MTALLQDVRHALRRLRKSPGFVAVTLLTLALGIGGSTAIFSVINAVMLRTLPFKDPGRLVLLKWKAKSIPTTRASSNYANCPPGGGPAVAGGDVYSDVPLDSGGCSFSLPFFEQLRSKSTVLSSVAAFVPAELSVNSDHQTSRVRGLLVSGGFFATLGVQATIGRVFTERDDHEGAVPGIVVSHRFWQHQLGGDHDVIGTPVLIGKTVFTVLGVIDSEFTQLDPGLSCDLWIPLAFKSKVPPYSPRETAPNAIWVELIGRLKSNVSHAQAASALSATFAANTTTGPLAILKANDAPQIALAPMAHGLATLRRNFSNALSALLATVGLLLLISCVNIAGLMLVRSVARRRELGMRIALGATRGRILSQLLTESMLLALAGGALGTVLGGAGARTLVSFFSRNWPMPLGLDVHPDSRVFAFTLFVSATVGLAFGVIPAFSSNRFGLLASLRADTGTALTGIGRALGFAGLIAIAQIALALPILATAGLVARTLANLRAENIGFNPQHLLVFRIDSTYSQKNPHSIYRDLQEQLRSLPGVVSVSRSGVALLSNEGMAGPISSDDDPSAQVRAHGLPMSSDFLTTLGIPLRQGRVFGEEESQRPHPTKLATPVVVNETLVRQVFGPRDPLGKYLHLGSQSGPTFEIVGVAGNAKYGRVRDSIWPTIYMPLSDWTGPMYFEVRTAIVPDVLIPEISSAINRFDSNLLLVGMKTETEQIDEDLYQERLMSLLAALFAVVAVIVACIGLYGLLAFQVARRTHEMGIRLALGADRTNLLKLILRQGAMLAIAGTLVGSAVALSLTRYLQSLLFGIKPGDPLTFIAVAALLIGVALLACYIPARRAAKVDPMVALRYE